MLIIHENIPPKRFSIDKYMRINCSLMLTYFGPIECFVARPVSIPRRIACTPVKILQDRQWWLERGDIEESSPCNKYNVPWRKKKFIIGQNLKLIKNMYSILASSQKYFGSVLWLSLLYIFKVINYKLISNQPHN